MPVILKCKEIETDKTVVTAPELVKHKRYPSMDRVVHRREDFAAGLAMHSNRIATYEVVNDEGYTMWHNADGMLYLYNNDIEQYAGDFWGTVNHGRLAGTTVDNTPKGKTYRSGAKNPYTWVGGTGMDGLYGVSGIHMNNGVDSKKSYFFFDDEIAAIGSGITDDGDVPVETIVENRKLKKDMSNVIKIDSEEIERESSDLPSVETHIALKVETKDLATSSHCNGEVAPQTTGKIVVEFDFMSDDAMDFGGFQVLNGTKNIAYLTMRNGMLGLRMPKSGSYSNDAISPLATVTAGKWHKIKLVIDMDTKTLNYYFDDNHIVAAKDHSTNADVSLEDRAFLDAGITQMDKINVVTPENGKTCVRVDNVKVIRQQ